MNEMTKEQAIQIIQQALSTVKATIQEHNMIQQAFKMLITDTNSKVNIKNSNVTDSKIIVGDKDGNTNTDSKTKTK